MAGTDHLTDRIPKFSARNHFYVPPPEFNGCFTTFFRAQLTIEDGHTISDQLQPEWGSIRFVDGNLLTARLGDTAVTCPRFLASGPSSLPTHFEVGSSGLWGIGFLPLGWCRFLDVDARDLANITCDGEQHPAFAKFAQLADVLCDAEVDEQAQFEAIVDLMRRLMRETRDDEKVIGVHHAMVDETISTVSEFADASGLNIRSLERICHRYFGFTPKLLLRRQRFMRSLTTFMLLPEANWTDAMDEHYHDQAQFTREFRMFMGMSPTEYASLDHPLLTAFVQARARDRGSAAQTLDRPD